MAEETVGFLVVVATVMLVLAVRRICERVIRRANDDNDGRSRG